MNFRDSATEDEKNGWNVTGSREAQEKRSKHTHLPGTVEGWELYPLKQTGLKIPTYLAKPKRLTTKSAMGETL